MRVTQLGCIQGNSKYAILAAFLGEGRASHRNAGHIFVVDSNGYDAIVDLDIPVSAVASAGVGRIRVVNVADQANLDRLLIFDDVFVDNVDNDVCILLTRRNQQCAYAGRGIEVQHASGVSGAQRIVHSEGRVVADLLHTRDSGKIVEVNDFKLDNGVKRTDRTSREFDAINRIDRVVGWRRWERIFIANRIFENSQLKG